MNNQSVEQSASESEFKVDAAGVRLDHVFGKADLNLDGADHRIKEVKFGEHPRSGEEYVWVYFTTHLSESEAIAIMESIGVPATNWGRFLKHSLLAHRRKSS